VVDAPDRVLAVDRDLGELQRTLGQRARELWARALRERHERSGITGWDFDALPRSVEVEIDGRRLRAYPALVDAESAVDLRLLESSEAADDATRDGVRRLFLLQLRTTVAKLEGQLSGAIAQGPLAVGASIAPRRQIVLRALAEAFGIGGPDGIPRSKTDFDARLAAGRTQLPGTMTQLGQTALELGHLLREVRAALAPLAGKAGILRAAHEDIQSQLEHLVPPDLMHVTPVARFDHVARYLRALQIRLQRLFHDPAKDQQKAAQVTPFWQRFQAQRDDLRSRGRPLGELDEVGWMIEELRVQTFAPELKTAMPISAQRLEDFWVTRVR
jgi:ATP-dependent helicase HrpA